MELKKQQNQNSQQNYLEDAFKLFDRDNDGVISVNEL